MSMCCCEHPESLHTSLDPRRCAQINCGCFRFRAIPEYQKEAMNPVIEITNSEPAVLLVWGGDPQTVTHVRDVGVDGLNFDTFNPLQRRVMALRLRYIAGVLDHMDRTSDQYCDEIDG